MVNSFTVSAAQPNIIYILADDLGYGELGCYGQEKIETPSLDKLCREGMKFTQHYSGSPVCAPSRCVLLTGKHTGHAYIRGNDEWRERGEVWSYAAMNKEPNLEGQRPLPAGTKTIASLLKTGGYTTACVGKWGLGAPNTDGVPNKQGFDFFYGYNCQRQAHTYYPRHLYRNEERVLLRNPEIAPNTKLPKGADPLKIESYANYQLTDYAGDLMFDAITGFVAENKAKPFFLYWATPIPHMPLQAPERWVNHYVKKFGDEEPYLGNKGYFPCRYPRATYAAMISYLDEQVGLLVKQLKEIGVYDNTLIIFTSDNGFSFNGGTQSPWFNSGGPFNSAAGWGKCSVYEGGIRVPLIAAWPGKIKPGSESDHISAFWDALPTLCEIAGVTPPADIDGISYLPTLLQQGNQKLHPYLYWEYPEAGSSQAVRAGKWKGIRKNISKRNMKIELFNLEEDMRESKDVAAANPEIVQKIAKIMQESHTQAELERFRQRALGDE
ncbi:MAG: arylsulfatase [Kiritimatiellae bacterium]|nr:arylsulfatase [Kiritimatiellia bacterium]